MSTIPSSEESVHVRRRISRNGAAALAWGTIYLKKAPRSLPQPRSMSAVSRAKAIIAQRIDMPIPRETRMGTPKGLLNSQETLSERP